MVYDVIVIGAGPAGMTAALYASRSNLKVLLLERGIPGGQMNNTSEIENYPGFPAILGPELAMKMDEGVMKFGTEKAYGTVQSLEDKGATKLVHCETESYETHAIVIATGCDHAKLGVAGESEYAGKGVSYCAVCDGPFFREKKLIVAGGGDSAIEEGIFLTRFADQVTVVHRRDTLRAQPLIQKRAFENPKMNFELENNIVKINGNGQVVTGVVLESTKDGSKREVACDGVFIYVGLIPLTEPFKSLGITDERGWIMTDDKMRTKVPGIYAIGDARAKGLRQVATAVGDGAVAGQQVYQYLTELAKA